MCTPSLQGAEGLKGSFLVSGMYLRFLLFPPNLFQSSLVFEFHEILVGDTLTCQPVAFPLQVFVVCLNIVPVWDIDLDLLDFPPSQELLASPFTATFGSVVDVEKIHHPVE